ncbi:MAG: 7-cyano-7-deazaguanine synthase [Nitrososphaerota archaeon]
MAEGVIVLLSGGIDSAVCLWWARQRGWQLYALTVNHYPLNHDRELSSAKALARAAGVVEHRIIELPQLKELADMKLAPPHPLSEAHGASPSYLPAKNLIYYGLAAAWAEELGIDKLMGGHISSDAQLYPDSSPGYLAKLNELINEGLVSSSRRPLRLLAPLILLSKAEVIKLGLRLGAPLELTWSCHERRKEPCGACGGCEARRRAFSELGLEDPALRVPSPSPAP